MLVTQGQKLILDHLRQIPSIPKGDIRQQIRQQINTGWHALAAKEQDTLLPQLLQKAKQGDFSPNTTVKQEAAQGRFPSGAGPAIHWLSSMLDSTKPEILKQRYVKLSEAEKETAEALRCRKPVRGIIDPLASSSLPAYLKNSPAIGSLPKGEPIKIGMVGKGASNIIAFYHLNKASERFQGTFFEYLDRVGGRMESKPFASGGFSEEGAMRLPQSGESINHILKEVGIGKKDIQEGLERPPFPNARTVDGKIFYEGKVIPWPKGQKAPSHPLFQQVVNKYQKLADTVLEPIENTRKHHDREGMKTAWQKNINHYMGKSFEEVLKKESHLTPKELKAFISSGVGAGSLKEYPGISALELWREEVGKLIEKQGLIPGGTTRFLQRLSEKTVTRPDGSTGSVEQSSKTLLNHEVSKVALNDEGKPVIHFKDRLTGKAGFEKFDMVFVSPAPSALAHIDLKGVLDKDTQRALKKFNMLASTKMTIKTENPFWKEANGTEKSGMPIVMQADDGKLNSLYCLQYPGEKQGTVVMDYRWEKVHQPDKEYFDGVVKTASKMSPEMAKHLKPVNDEIHVADWTKAPFYGAFRALLPKEDTSHATLSYKVRQNKAPVVLTSADTMVGGFSDTAAVRGFWSALKTIKEFGGKLYPNAPKFWRYDYSGVNSK